MVPGPKASAAVSNRASMESRVALRRLDAEHRPVDSDERVKARGAWPVVTTVGLKPCAEMLADDVGEGSSSSMISRVGRESAGQVMMSASVVTGVGGAVVGTLGAAPQAPPFRVPGPPEPVREAVLPVRPGRWSRDRAR